MIDLIKSILNLFKTTCRATNYGNELEDYIISKNPQSIYEVEYWTQEFDKKTVRSF